MAAEDSRVECLSNNIRYKFRNPLLANHIINRIADKNSDSFKCFERLEFLGDAVLNMVMSDMLFRQFPKLSRGALSIMKAKLVCTKTLVKFSQIIGLHSFIKREGSLDYYNNTLENSVEALIGAIYIDGGFHQAKAFIENGWEQQVKDSNHRESSYKTLLNKWVQQHRMPNPEYILAEKIGPHHNSKVKIILNVEGVKKAEATARSRKEAENKAAKEILKTLKNKH